MKQITTNSDTIISRDINLERYLKEIRNAKPLTKEEEKTTIKKAQAGDTQAYHKIITSNLRFVVNCAKEYQYPGIDFNDLVMAGNLGLIDAVHKFNTKNDVKFISYAVWWIKNAIIEFIKESVRIVHVPQNQLSSIKQLRDIQSKLEQEYEVNLDIEQTGDIAGIDLTQLRGGLAAITKASSLDAPLTSDDSDDSECVLESVLADKTQNIYTIYDTQHNKEKVKLAVDKLTSLQQQIISLSFGLEDGIERTNEDIAEVVELTPERVRQIRIQSLDKLRNYTILNAKSK